MMLSDVKVKVEAYLLNILAVGFFVVLTGMFIVDRGAYKTVTYLTLVLPALICLLLNFSQFRDEYLRGGVRWILAALFFLAVSSFWGDGSMDTLTALRRVLLFVISGYGIFYLYHHHRAVFVQVAVFGFIVSALISSFWMLDYYVLLDHPLHKRFMSGRMDYLGLYGSDGYGSIFNPLLYSHLLVFYLAGITALFSVPNCIKGWQKPALLISGAVFFVALIVSQTRMAWGVFAAVCGYELVRCFKLKGVVLLSVLALLALAAVMSNRELVLARGWSYRPEIWLAIMQQVMDKPWFGYGFGSSVVVSPEGLNRTWYDTHNVYLAVLYYSGFVGMGLLSIAIVKLCWEARKLAELRPAFVIFLVVLVLGGLTDGDGLLARPSEHWFNLILPVLLMLALVRSGSLSSRSRT